ncbi:hypothetical protein [Flavivirga sp. 57AJ16]|uniref:hypothetical protein n=1 Tax=Flavivirga sp. 57AJ16 TaxID=3025307 RepID=UPI0023662859|nr:hypothetical protein [Flavivirga sp. 57AJ16]MDD7885618.1 hypothetical protein [Flavivirga sp. 57AJ16]
MIIFLTYLRPKKEFELKEDFSNYKEIEYDTFPSLISGSSNEKRNYNEYWAKRIVTYGEYFKNSGDNFIRGILVERKDSIYGNNNEFKYKDRYLFVNKKISVRD